MKGNIKEFVAEAFDYRNQLMAVSIDRAANRYLLEHIAAGFVKYKGVDGLIKNIDKYKDGLADFISKSIQIYCK